VYGAIFREFLCSTDKVSVDVGFSDSGDAEVVFGGERPVLVNISLRIDDERLARFLASYQVRVLRKIGIEYLTE
jgi:hypothetical protein